MPAIFERHVSGSLDTAANTVSKRVATGSLCVAYSADGIDVTLNLRMLTLTGAVNLPVADETGIQIKSRIASIVAPFLMRRGILNEVICGALNALLPDNSLRDYLGVIGTLRDQWEGFAKLYNWETLRVPAATIPWERHEVIGDAAPAAPDAHREIDLKTQSDALSGNKRKPVNNKGHTP